MRSSWPAADGVRSGVASTATAEDIAAREEKRLEDYLSWLDTQEQGESQNSRKNADEENGDSSLAKDDDKAAPSSSSAPNNITTSSSASGPIRAYPHHHTQQQQRHPMPTESYLLPEARHPRDLALRAQRLDTPPAQQNSLANIFGSASGARVGGGGRRNEEQEF